MISNSIEETKNIAHKFASTLVGGDVVFLEGDLGAGKTTFVQGVLEALGYTDPVRSPTFSIMNVYPIARGQPFEALRSPQAIEEGTPPMMRIIHLDFYRFETVAEIRSLGLDEMMQDTKNVFIIEWPQKGLEKQSPMQATKKISLETIGLDAREITIN